MKCLTSLKNAILLTILSFAFINPLLAAPSYVIGELKGHLGNQMFIIAATTSLALDHNATPVFPDLVSKNQFNLRNNREKLFPHLNVNLPKRTKIKYTHQEPHFYYSPIPYHRNMKINGYFQSEKYFANHKQEIIELFAPPAEIKNYLMTTYSDIINHPNAVSIHARSYARENMNIHITLGREYFEKAMLLFPEDTLFVVFANNMAWCKEMLGGLSANIRFIEGEHFHKDFYLMSMCKHNIITNSTFSWWAAYLNRNPDKIVVAPKTWFNPKSGKNTKDLYPSEWVIID